MSGPRTPGSRRRLAGALAAAALTLAGGSVLTPTATAATTADDYSVTVGAKGAWTHPDDTPASPYLDKDGTFYFQQAHALYGADDPRAWDFYTGKDLDTATRSAAISDAVDPANAKDRNNDTTWRCDNNSPTGKESTKAPAGSGYSQRNYCDLAGVWVDPDTGDWYGLVHNEFTPQPFGDGLHYDAIDYAVSTDQGHTWKIKDHVLTSPFSTERGDDSAFPEQTFDYGDGDPRLYADVASGYFYVFYGSRVVDKGGSWKAFHGHVARAPISAKMAPDSWRKWYDGAWSEPGKGGQESNMVPVDPTHPSGYTEPAKEYDPKTPGTVDEQVAAGKTPATSPLFVMDITYNAYLGLYIGEPQNPDQSGDAPQQFYATDDLGKQQWKLIGDTGDHTNASWYRWFLDSANRTSSAVVGRDFRSYCSFGCSDGSSSEYLNLRIEGPPAAAPVATGRALRLTSGQGRVLAQAAHSSATTSLPAASGAGRAAWVFRSEGDGSYRVVNSATGGLLGVDAGSTRDRAWGTAPRVTAAGAGGADVGQQWFVLPGRTEGGAADGTYRLVNRYSGLVLGLPGQHGGAAETVPARTWSDTTGSHVGAARVAAQQTLSLRPVRR